MAQGDFFTRDVLLNSRGYNPALAKAYTEWQPKYGESEGDKANAFQGQNVAAALQIQQMLDVLDQYGVNSTAELPDNVRASIHHGGQEYSQPSGSFAQQLGSFITSPPVLIAAGGLAGMGAFGGTGAATGTDAAWGVNPQGAAGGAAGGTGITAGAGGVTGLTAGTTTGAIGGGALGSGLTAGGTAAGTGAAAGAGALGAGYFGSETAYPVAGGQTAAATGGATGGTTAAQQTALSKILAGTGTSADYLTLFGQVAPALLGAYASDRQADALGDMSARYEAMGAPYRDKLGELYSDPTAFLNSPEVKVPVQMGTDALARSLSTQGNPAGSGAALQQLQSYASDQLFGRLGQEKDRLGGFGGLTQYASAAPQIGVNAIGAEGNVYNALGYGIGATTQPPRSLQDILRQYNLSQGLT